MASSRFVVVCCIQLMSLVSSFVMTFLSHDIVNVNLFASRKSQWNNNYVAFVITAFDFSSMFSIKTKRDYSKMVTRIIRFLLGSLLCIRASSSASPFIAADAGSCGTHSTAAGGKFFQTQSEHRYPHGSIAHVKKLVNSFEKSKLSPISGHTSVRIYASLHSIQACDEYHIQGEPEKENLRYHYANHEYRIQVLEVPWIASRSLNVDATKYNSDMLTYAPFFHSERMPLCRSHQNSINEFSNLDRPFTILNNVKVPRRKCSDIYGAVLSHETCRQVLLVKMWRVDLDQKGSMVRRFLVGSEVQVVNYLDQSPVIFHFRLKPENEAKRRIILSSRKAKSIVEEVELDLGNDLKHWPPSQMMGFTNATHAAEEIYSLRSDMEGCTEANVHDRSTLFLRMTHSDHETDYFYHDCFLEQTFCFILLGILFLSYIRFGFKKCKSLVDVTYLGSGAFFKTKELDNGNSNDHRNARVISPQVFVTSISPRSPQRARSHDKKFISFSDERISFDERSRYFSTNGFEQFMHRKPTQVQGEAFESMQHSSNKTDLKCLNSETVRSPPAIHRIGNRFAFSPSDQNPSSPCSHRLSVPPSTVVQKDKNQNLSPRFTIGDEMVHIPSHVTHQVTNASTESSKDETDGTLHNGDLSKYQVETFSYEQKSTHHTCTCYNNIILHSAAEQRGSKYEMAEIKDIGIGDCTMHHQRATFEKAKVKLTKDDVEGNDDESSQESRNPSYSSDNGGLHYQTCWSKEHGELTSCLTIDIKTSHISSERHKHRLFQTSIASDIMGKSDGNLKSYVFHSGGESIGSVASSPGNNYATGRVLRVYSDSKRKVPNDNDSVDTSYLSRNMIDKRGNTDGRVDNVITKCIEEYVQFESLAGKQKRKFGIFDNLHDQRPLKKSAQYDEDETNVIEHVDVNERNIMETMLCLDEKENRTPHEIDPHCQLLGPESRFDKFQKVETESMVCTSSGGQPPGASDQHIKVHSLIELDKATVSTSMEYSANDKKLLHHNDDELVHHGSTDNNDLHHDLLNNSIKSDDDKCAMELISCRMDSKNVYKSVDLSAFSRFFQAPVWEFCENTVDYKHQILDKTSAFERLPSGASYARTPKQECSKDESFTSKRVHSSKKRKRNPVSSYQSIPTEILIRKPIQNSESALLALTPVNAEFNTTTDIGVSDNSESSLLTKNAFSTSSSKRSRSY